MSMSLTTLNDRPERLPSRQLAKAKRAQTNAELVVFGHSLQAHVLTEMDRLDSQALAEVSGTAMESELGLLDYGLRLAGESPAKAAIVARHVERTVELNDRRIRRRFG